MKFTVSYINPKVFGTEGFKSNEIPPADLKYVARGRSRLTMPGLNGNNINILTPALRGEATSDVQTSGGVLERIFDGNSYTIYFKVKQLLDTHTGMFELFDFGNSSGAQRGMLIYTYAGHLYTTFSDGILYDEAIQIDAVNTVLGSSDWVEVFIEIDFPLKQARCSMYKYSDGTSIGINRNADISTFTFVNSDNWKALIFGTPCFAHLDFKKFLGLKSLSQCRDSSYVTDIQIYYPTLWDGTDVSGNAHHFKGTMRPTSKYYTNISTYCLDYGYTQWRSNTHYLGIAYEDRQIPNKPDGTPIVRIGLKDISGFNLYNIGNHTGSLNYHNLSDSLLDIPYISWNKNSITIFENVVRTRGYFDISHPFRWHIFELDYLIYSQTCKINNRGLNFFKITNNSFATEDRLLLKEIFSYNVNKTGNYLTRILTYTGDQQAMDACLRFECNSYIRSGLVIIYLQGVIGTTTPQIYWGDGIKLDIIDMTGILNVCTHTYSTSDIFYVYITNPENLLGITTTTGNGIPPLNNNFNEFHKAVNIESLILDSYAVGMTGTINGINTGLKNITMNIGKINNIVGSINPFMDIEIFQCNSNITGTLSDKLQLKKIFLAGGTTIDVDITLLTLLTHIESYALSSFGHGSVTGLINLVHICWGSPNAFTGILSCPNFEYLDNYGGSSMTGDITGFAKLWKFVSHDCNNAFTGSLAGKPLLEIFNVFNDLSTLTKPVTVIGHPLLCWFNGVKWNFLSAEVNQILADVWTNKDAPKGFPTYRWIILNGGTSQAPTGQGIIDKAALQAYRSPTPPGTAALWTILTN